MAKITDTHGKETAVTTDKADVDVALTLGEFDGPLMWDNSPTGNATRYEAGGWVETPDGKGLVDDVVQEGTVDGMDATSSSPVYAVIMLDEATVTFYRAGGLEATEGPDVDLEDPVDDAVEANSLEGTLKTWLNILGADITANDWSMPPSWRKSETPSRVILLDAWSSMGAQFDCGGACCMGELGSRRLCAAMKDEALGTERWRGGWAD